MAEPAEPVELPIRVEPSDIDELGRVNNVTYLRWVQDAAVAY
jgi:acyl-CoA thioester hydrolase